MLFPAFAKRPRRSAAEPHARGKQLSDSLCFHDGVNIICPGHRVEESEQPASLTVPAAVAGEAHGLGRFTLSYLVNWRRCGDRKLGQPSELSDPVHS